MDFFVFLYIWQFCFRSSGNKKVSLMNYNIYNLFMFLFVHFNFINCHYFEFILT